MLVASSALAQKPQTQVVKGKIAAVEGSTVVIDQAKGAGQAKVKLKDKAVIMTVGKATLAEIKPGAYHRRRRHAAGGRQPEGDPRDDLPGNAARHRRGPLSLEGARQRPELSTMTNATVDTTVAGVEGQVLTVKYKGGTQKIIIGKDAEIVSNIPGSAGRSQARRCHHRPGGRRRAADGSLETARVNIGRGDFVP